VVRNPPEPRTRRCPERRTHPCRRVRDGGLRAFAAAVSIQPPGTGRLTSRWLRTRSRVGRRTRPGRRVRAGGLCAVVAAVSTARVGACGLSPVADAPLPGTPHTPRPPSPRRRTLCRCCRGFNRPGRGRLHPTGRGRTGAGVRRTHPGRRVRDGGLRAFAAAVSTARVGAGCIPPAADAPLPGTPHTPVPPSPRRRTLCRCCRGVTVQMPAGRSLGAGLPDRRAAMERAMKSSGCTCCCWQVALIERIRST
jgi:hypothetical protein